MRVQLIPWLFCIAQVTGTETTKKKPIKKSKFFQNVNNNQGFGYLKDVDGIVAE